VIVFVRVVDGVMRKGDTVHFAASGMEYEIIEVGTRTPGCTYSLWL
jgi:translation elongation factor EF-4